MAPAAPSGRRSFPIGRLLLAVALVALVVRTIDVLLVIFLAVILGIYLDAVTDLLQRRLGVPRAARAARSAWPLTLGALVGIVLLIAPPVTEQVQDLLANLPQLPHQLDANINELIRQHPAAAARRLAGAEASRRCWPAR